MYEGCFWSWQNSPGTDPGYFLAKTNGGPVSMFEEKRQRRDHTPEVRSRKTPRGATLVSDSGNSWMEILKKGLFILPCELGRRRNGQKIKRKISCA